ncbi:MAG: hypothetical protein KGN01_06745 [Patescibacteria group bacterium]|nr:hypothetical protein [Patescibacteria group bacterium]
MHWQFYIDNHIVESKLFDDYKAYLFTGVFNCAYFDDYYLVSACPKKVHRDERGRLHCAYGTAIEWLDDTKNFFIHGVSFPDEDVFNQITKRTIPAKTAISLPDMEQRTIACRILGYDTIIAELNAKVIDHGKRRIAGRKDKLDYYLYEIDLHDDRLPAKFLKVECPSTGKETLLRVDPHLGNIDAARAWTFPLGNAKYDLVVET